MQTSLWSEIRQFFFKGSALARLVGINLLVFVGISLVRVVLYLFNQGEAGEAISHWLGISSNVHVILHRPWTLFTYMFLHFDLLHVLFNMVVLYVGGRLFSDFIGQGRLVPTYLFGGLAGGIVYVVSFNVFPAFEQVVSHAVAIGASASVLAIFIAIAVYMPNYQLPLLLLGRVRLKYIALFFVVMDLISIDKGNPGGHLAHLGGALWGFAYASLLKKGRDPARLAGLWMDALIRVFSRRPRLRVEYQRDRPVTDEEFNDRRAEDREKMNAILDKISQRGYDSLSKQEKQFLFKMGDKP